MHVEDVEITRLKPYAENPRVISQSSITKVASSIAEFGFLVPVIAEPGGSLVAGHTRVLAAKRIGMTTVPVIWADNLTPAQIRAFRILDNRSSQENTWDFVKLKGEVDALLDADFDLKLTGFEQNELAPLLAEQSPMPADDEPPAEQPDEKPVTHTVKFSTAQYETVLRAIQKVRESESDKNIEEARAIELICGDYIA